MAVAIAGRVVKRQRRGELYSSTELGLHLLVGISGAVLGFAGVSSLVAAGYVEPRAGWAKMDTKTQLWVVAGASGVAAALAYTAACTSMAMAGAKRRLRLLEQFEEEDARWVAGLADGVARR